MPGMGTVLGWKGGRDGLCAQCAGATAVNKVHCKPFEWEADAATHHVTRRQTLTILSIDLLFLVGGGASIALWGAGRQPFQWKQLLYITTEVGSRTPDIL